MSKKKLEVVTDVLKSFSIKPPKSVESFFALKFEDIPENQAIIAKLSEYCVSKTLIVQFSEEEIEQAKWLRVEYTWSQFYPEPQNDFIDSLYGKDNYCPECHLGKEQTANFEILNNIIKWKRSFLQLNWVYDEFFLSKTTRALLETSDLKGFHFRDVNCKKTKTLQTDMYQLVVENIAEPMFDYDKLAYAEDTSCPVCGVHRVLLSPCTIFMADKKKLDQIDVDIFKSNEVFGQGWAGYHEIFISNKFYRFLKEHKISDGFKYEPVLVQ